MKRFSNRQGLRPVRVELQITDVDPGLRAKLWNVLKKHYWDFAYSQLGTMREMSFNQYLENLFHNFLKKPVDLIPSTWSSRYEYLRNLFFGFEWYEVYDFIEFTADSFLGGETSKSFRRECNSVLEEELSGFRFVADQIAPITDEQEIATIEQAIARTSNISSVRVHLAHALELLSDKKQPDYRNSIKESISAVEALCRIVAKKEKATLGDALKSFSPGLELHPALSGAFDKLYGYTNDASGIRHALMDVPNLHQEDALFMLISCSSFISYLIAKCSRMGKRLDI